MATKTKKAEVKTEALLPDADIHHVVRKVGVSAMEDGTITGEQADAYLRGWLQNGYRLAFVQSLGIEPNGVNILYILIKDA